MYTRNTLTLYGNYLTDSIVLDLYAGYVTDLSFRDTKIDPCNLDYGNTTVVCDPRVFSAEDLANLSFRWVDGYYSETL